MLVVGVVEESDVVRVSAGGDHFSADRHLAVEQLDGAFPASGPATAAVTGNNRASRPRRPGVHSTRDNLKITQIIIVLMTQTAILPQSSHCRGRRAAASGQAPHGRAVAAFGGSCTHSCAAAEDNPEHSALSAALRGCRVLGGRGSGARTPGETSSSTSQW
jgi:hypothetical protein